MTSPDIDTRILEVLVADGRIPIRELAERVDQAETTVRDRLHRMEDEGLIRAYRARVDLEKVGVTTTTWLLASITEVPRDLAVHALKARSQVLAVHLVASHPQRVLIHVASLEDQNLLDFVEDAEKRFGLHIKSILPVARVLRPDDEQDLPELP